MTPTSPGPADPNAEDGDEGENWLELDPGDVVLVFRQEGDNETFVFDDDDPEAKTHGEYLQGFLLYALNDERCKTEYARLVAATAS